MSQTDNVDFYHQGNAGNDDQNPEAGSGDSENSSGASEGSSGRVLSWSAPEYVDHQHSAGWYMLLLLGTAVLATAVYFLYKDYFAVGSIVAVGLIVAVFAARKPRGINYQLSDMGLEVGQRKYSYSLFKAFTIIREGGLSSVEMIPLKRFMPSVSAYFEPKEEQQVIDIIGEHLPYTEHKPGAVDKLSHRLRL
jgi:hypothetical protein